MNAIDTGIPQVALSNGEYLEVDAGESLDLFLTFTDSSGAAVTAANLSALTLTVYKKSTLELINSINAIDVNNTGRGTLNGTQMDVRLDGDDTVPIDSKDELHVARFVYSYSDGVAVRTNKHRVQYWVRWLPTPS